MVDPVIALTVFSIVAGLTALLSWPRYGALPRLFRLIRLTERVRTEDALKHLYKREYEGATGTVDDLAGALEMSRAQAAHLLQRLEELELAEPQGAAATLTEVGRAYALRIVRTHRLWERYLADRTGVHPSEWHERAETREHALSPSDTETLAARLGHPLYDPHGDPIPTSAGDLPPRHGIPLTGLARGEAGEILHIEDEPSEVYDTLLEKGLSPGMELQLLDVLPGELRVRVEGRDILLGSLEARNITIGLRPGLSVPGVALETLAHLVPGERARVLRIVESCRGPQRRRLLDLGLVPGTVVEAELVSASGDPTAYRIRGALIGLRRSQAKLVRIAREVPAEVVAS